MLEAVGSARLGQVAAGEHEQHRQAGDAARDVAGQLEAGGVRDMDVLDQQHAAA